MDEEQKPGNAAEGLSASAFLARYGSFLYIEARSGMKMSDKKTSSESGLPRAYFAKGACALRRASNATRGICFALSNRELELLEPPLTHRKQTTAPRSNRELSTNRCSCNFHSSGALLSNGLPRQMHFLTGSAPQTEFDVTYRKQTTAHFLTGSRIAQLNAGICAKMSAQISSKLSAQTSEIR